MKRNQRCSVRGAVLTEEVEVYHSSTVTTSTSSSTSSAAFEFVNAQKSISRKNDFLLFTQKVTSVL